MLQKVQIDNFKSIDSAQLDLEKINVLVGANNSGKSSILQALQFATSVAQTARLYSQSGFNRKDIWATSVSPNHLIYSPVKDPYTLVKGGFFKGKLEIKVSFVTCSGEQVTASFNKGKNKNIAARFKGREIGESLSSLEEPFCMYVPGLAGIPSEEEIMVVGAVRRRAAKGDSNTVFRNVINLLKSDDNKDRWELFLEDMRRIFNGIDFKIYADPNADGYIDVQFRLSDAVPYLPIDLAGTGVLQAIQIAAYVNYFQPELLLLDEPDSHLHPNNQRALAELLKSIANRTKTTIIISTHSRHIMASLRNDAKFFLVKDGIVIDSEFDHYDGLIELGALDDYDRINNNDLKYIILTEDQSYDSKKYLSCILESSGYDTSKFKIYSYNGVSKMESAKMFAEFLLELNPNLKVVIYRDRDGLYDEEIKKIKKEIEFNQRVKCVVSKFNDIEMYYCNEDHLIFVCQEYGLSLSKDNAKNFIDESINEHKELSKKKFYSHRLDIAKKNREDLGAAQVEAEYSFKQNERLYAYGKRIIGSLKEKLQNEFQRDINICQSSDHIVEEQFKDILSSV